MSLKHDYQERVEFPSYSNVELRAFGEWLEKFKHPVEVRKLGNPSEREIIYPIDLNEAMVEFGAYTKRIHAGVPSYAIALNILDRDEYGGIKRYERPSKYELFQHKYDSWLGLQSRTKYAKAHENEHLEAIAEEMAGEMRIPESDIVPEFREPAPVEDEF